MLFILSAAAAVATIQPAQDVAYEELVAGRNQAAIASIEANTDLDTDSPARLINLGVAHARSGNTERARSMFTAVATSRDVVEMETANGEWVTSRDLANRALAMLNAGEFSTKMARR